MRSFKFAMMLISGFLIVGIIYFMSNNGILNRERALYNLYKDISITQVNIDKIARLLPGLDWQAYDNISNNGSFLLLSKLNEFSFEKSEHISAIMNSTKNLDGVAAEQYSILIYSIFEQNKYEFINSLAQLDKEQYATVTDYLFYQFDYLDDMKEQKLIIDLRSIDPPDSNEKFISILKEIIDKLENTN